MNQHVKLRGSPPGSSSTVYFSPDGTLVVEFYDFGEEAQSSMGNDVAFLLHLDPAAQAQFASSIGAEGPLLDAIAARFANYFEVRKWLDAHSIPYRHEFDSWA
ncbi:MAG TPA: hypothetical protein DEH78_06830 [Solibacterales bacterium]|nr:hypothetical protein [Bryobacterales bacterium]